MTKTVMLCKKNFGIESKNTLNSLNLLGLTYLDINNSLAVDILKISLEVSQKLLGNNHEDTLLTQNSLQLAHEKINSFPS